MSRFIFNGHDSEDLGIMIRKPIVRPTWGNEYAEAALAGGLRKLMQKSNYYDNASLTIEAYVHEATQEKMRQIYSVLNGEGKLWISTAPEEYIDVIMSPLIPEAVALLSAELPINMTCLPFAYAVSPTELDLTAATDYMTVPNAGTMYSAPEIRFVPTAEQVTVNVNGKEFIVSGLSEQVSNQNTAVIDCDLEVVYYISGDQKIDITYKSKYNFPLLHTGDNYIKHDGNISSMSVNVKERWL